MPRKEQQLQYGCHGLQDSAFSTNGYPSWYRSLADGYKDRTVQLRSGGRYPNPYNDCGQHNFQQGHVHNIQWFQTSVALASAYQNGTYWALRHFCRSSFSESPSRHHGCWWYRSASGQLIQLASHRQPQSLPACSLSVGSVRWVSSPDFSTERIYVASWLQDHCQSEHARS